MASNVPVTGVARVGYQQRGLVPRLPGASRVGPVATDSAVLPGAAPGMGLPPMAGRVPAGFVPPYVTPPWSWSRYTWPQWGVPPAWQRPPWDWRSTEDEWAWWGLGARMPGWCQPYLPERSDLARWANADPMFTGGPVMCRGCQAGWDWDERGRHVVPGGGTWECQRVKWRGRAGAVPYPLRQRAGWWWQLSALNTGDIQLLLRQAPAPWLRPPWPPWGPQPPWPGPGPGGGGGGGGGGVTTPVVTLSANPQTVAAGGTSILTWTSSGASVVQGSWSTVNLGMSGSVVVTPSVTTVYTVTAVGGGGTSHASQTVVVSAAPPLVAPTLQFTSTALTVPYQGSATLAWSTTDATSVVASGSWSGSRALSGSAGTGVLTANSTFTLVASGPGGSVTRSVSIAVTPPVFSVAYQVTAALRPVGTDETGYDNGVYGNPYGAINHASLPVGGTATGLTIYQFFSGPTLDNYALILVTAYAATTTALNQFDGVIVVDDGGTAHTFTAAAAAFQNQVGQNSSWWWSGPKVMATVGKVYTFTFYKA